MTNPNVHVLANGATVITVSAHPFTFSDGTVSLAQGEEVVKALTLQRQSALVGTIKGMRVNVTRMILSTDQQTLLENWCRQADVVLVPFPVLTALREQGIRERFPNALAFNATKETMRSAPDQKVVDLDNWSY